MKRMIAFPVFCLSLISLADAATLTGHVVGVTDGDTITVLDENNQTHEVRLSNIDAPETSCHQRKPSNSDTCTETSQPFGKAAKQSLSAILYDRDVRVNLEHGQSYGRAVGTVYVNTLDANLEQIRKGYAWHYLQYAQRQQDVNTFNQYQKAEQAARTNHIGLWKDSNPVAPWDYRHAR